MKNIKTYLFSSKYIIALTFVFALTTIYSCSKDDTAEPSDPAGMDDGGNNDDSGNKTAPSFSLESLDDGTIALSDYKDKVVVLFFFGNNCPSCKSSASEVEDSIHQHYSSNDTVFVLGLDQWDGNSSSVQSFKNTTGVTFPLLLKASGVASNYKTTYDRLIVVDKNTKIRFTGSQAAKNQINSVVNLVDKLLKEED